MQIGCTLTGTDIIPDPQIGVRNENARAKTPGALLAQIKDIAGEFYRVGFPKFPNPVTLFAIAQTMLESDWMTSSVAHEDNNYSGIYWLDKPYQDATKGSPRPKSEGGGNYAKYATFGKWAKDFLRILSLNRGGKGRPIDAKTPQQYLDRLKANEYFTATNYYTSFNSALKKVWDALNYGSDQDKKFLQAYQASQNPNNRSGEGPVITVTEGQGITDNKTFDQDRTTTGRGHKLQDMWGGLSFWAKAGVIAAAVVVVVVVVKK